MVVPSGRRASYREDGESKGQARPGTARATIAWYVLLTDDLIILLCYCLVSVWSQYVFARVLPSMLQSFASRTAKRNSIYHKALARHHHHLGRANGLLLDRPVPLISGGGHSYAPAVHSTHRYYAQQTPPGGSQGGGGGIPGFKFPMQQQYGKGDALKEFVRALLTGVFFSFFADAFRRCCSCRCVLCSYY